MLQALANAFKVEELRRKILYVFAMLAVFRLGAHIPLPGVDVSVLRELFETGLFGFLDMFAGGALQRATVFAMGITPYITASIIMQLLTAVVPYLEELSKEGEEGRKKIAQYTRYGTVLLGLLQGTGLTLWIRNIGALPDPGLYPTFLIILTLTSGTAFLMWVGEQITENGIGNGISILIFAGIISRLPASLVQMVTMIRTGAINIFSLLIFAIVALFIIAGVVLIQQGQRKIPVQYAKRVVGRKVYGGQSTHIPMRVNQAGVMPIIFASSLLAFPATIVMFIDHPIAQSVANSLQFGTTFHTALYGLFTIFFTYFYTAITFNPVDVADNMKKYGGFVPGRRPGRSTAQYLDRVLTRITLVGALFLAFMAVLPNFIMQATGLQIYFGGTALLIAVGVALRTMQQIESHLLMRHYDGFMS